MRFAFTDDQLAFRDAVADLLLQLNREISAGERQYDPFGTSEPSSQLKLDPS